MIEEINAIEKKVESLMNKTGNHVSASQDFFHHMKNRSNSFILSK